MQLWRSKALNIPDRASDIKDGEEALLFNCVTGPTAVEYPSQRERERERQREREREGERERERERESPDLARPANRTGRQGIAPGVAARVLRFALPVVLRLCRARSANSEWTPASFHCGGISLEKRDSPSPLTLDSGSFGARVLRTRVGLTSPSQPMLRPRRVTKSRSPRPVASAVPSPVMTWILYHLFVWPCCNRNAVRVMRGSFTLRRAGAGAGMADGDADRPEVEAPRERAQ